MYNTLRLHADAWGCVIKSLWPPQPKMPNGISVDPSTLVVFVDGEGGWGHLVSIDTVFVKC